MRVYALFGAGLVLVFLPGFLAKLGVDRVRPVQLASIPRSDGSLPGLVLAEQRKTSIAAISMDDGPWVPAGGWKVSRELRYLPPGTPVAFRETAAANGDRAISGRVVETRRSPEAIAAALSLSLVAVAFAIAGAGMAAGATNRLALLAAGMLAGFGHFLAAHFLEPNASMVADPSWRNGVVLLWISFPRHLSFLWLLSFLSVFPTDLWSTRVSRYSRRLLATLALFQVVFMFVSQLPGTFERLSPARQALTLGVARRLLLLIFVLGSVSALSLLVQQVRSYRRAAVAGQTRRRAEILRAAFLVGFGPALVLAVAQASSLALTGELAVSRTVMAFSYLPALLIPPALAYSVLAPRVESVGILVRKAALFGFAQKTVRVAALVPLAGLAFYLWMHRQSRLDELLALHPFLLAGAVGASIVGLTTADRARGAVERLFFRRKGDAARTLRELAEKTREAKDVAELADLLTSGSDKALGLESAALFVREPGSSYLAGFPRNEIFVPTVAERGRKRDGEAVFARRQLLLGYEPGYAAMPWLEDGAKLIKAGSDIVFEMHFNPNGKEAVDRSELGLYFSDKAPAQRVLAIDTLRDLDLQIPPKQPDYLSQSVDDSRPPGATSLHTASYACARQQYGGSCPLSRRSTRDSVERPEVRLQLADHLRS